MSVYEKQILMHIWIFIWTSLLNLSRWVREKSILQDSTSEGSAVVREQSRLIKVQLMFFREYSRSNKEGCMYACMQAPVCVCACEYECRKFSWIPSLSHVWLFVTPWTTARQASLSITNSQSLPKLMSIELVMPSNHLILCCPLLLLPSIFPASGSFQMS